MNQNDAEYATVAKAEADIIRYVAPEHIPLYNTGRSS